MNLKKKRIKSSISYFLYLRSYRSKLVITEEVEFPAVWITAKVKGFISVNCKSQNPQEEHAHRAKEQSVELANHSGRPQLDHKEQDRYINTKVDRHTARRTQTDKQTARQT